MRRLFCTLVLLASAAGSAAAQVTPARRDTVPAKPDSAAADSLALVRELEGMQARRDTSPGQPTGSGSVQRLLPDISVVGDFVADLSPQGSTQEGGKRFGVREVEIAAQAAVDPYFRGDVFLGISDLEGIAIEQAYLTTTSLPYGLEARLGRFLMPFGKLNTTHRHDLHTVEYPWVVQTFFGPEGLKGTGVYGSRVFSPFGFYQELQVTAVDGLGETAGLATAEPINKRLGGLGYSARLRNYVDLSQATNFELSFSALTGKLARPVAVAEGAAVNAFATRQTTLAADLTYRWRPLQQGLYHSLILQGEVMHQLNADPGSTVTLPDGSTAVFEGPRRNFTGAYGFARWQLTQRNFIGARYDWVQDPSADGNALTAGSGYLEFFPSEFSKLTAAYERFMPAVGDAVNRILLQATFALGPHKPHPF
ncbi:MAG TPA: hypothetical protein VGO40_13320 [Longimicrobium sp.]|jgi:hypothetical protein|nr:hypothetical protein [Longimicrobium sp.]